MNKTFLFLIASILLINMVNAQISIQPQPLQATTQINREAQFQITITNKYDFRAFDFEFGSLTSKGFTFSDISIEPNSSQTITISFLPTTSMHENIQVPVKFHKLKPLYVGSQTFEINITDYGLDGVGGIHHKIIREGDTIKWNNFADGTRTITSGSFNNEMAINGSFQYPFNSIGNYDYQIFIAGLAWYTGTIEVINKTSQEKVTNPNENINWVVNLDSILNPTNLSIENLKSSYEIEYTKSDFGTIKIRNNGTELAELVTLSSNSEWISFDKNNLNIEQEQERYVEYTIVPIVFSTNETDKSYEVEIKIKGSNTKEYTKRINIYIPYKEIKFDESDPEYLLKLLENFCNRNPGNVFCNPPNATDGNGSVVYRDTQIPLNLTATQFYDLLKRFQRIEDSNSRTDNSVKTFVDAFTNFMTNQGGISNKSLSLQQQNEKKERTRKNATWLIAFFIMLIVIIGGVIKLVNKEAYKKYLARGQFRYRR